MIPSYRIIAHPACVCQVAEFFLFAGLMYVTVIIFTAMAMFYKYVDHVVVTDENDTDTEMTLAYANKAMAMEESDVDAPNTLPPFPSPVAQRSVPPADSTPDTFTTHM